MLFHNMVSQRAAVFKACRFDPGSHTTIFQQPNDYKGIYFTFQITISFYK